MQAGPLLTPRHAEAGEEWSGKLIRSAFDLCEGAVGAPEFGEGPKEVHGSGHCGGSEARGHRQGASILLST